MIDPKTKSPKLHYIKNKRLSHSHRQYSFSKSEEEKKDTSTKKVYIPIKQQIRKMTKYVDKKLDKHQSEIRKQKFQIPKNTTPNIILKMFRKPPKSPTSMKQVRQSRHKVIKISKLKPKSSYKISRIKKFGQNVSIKKQETARIKRKKKAILPRIQQTPQRRVTKNKSEKGKQGAQFERYQYSPSPKQKQKFLSKNLKRRRSNLRNSNYIPKNVEEIHITKIIKLSTSALKKKRKIYQTKLKLTTDPPGQGLFELPRSISIKKKRSKTPNNRFDYVKDQQILKNYKNIQANFHKKQLQKLHHELLNSHNQSFNVKETHDMINNQITIINYSFASPRIQKQNSAKGKKQQIKSIVNTKQDKKKILKKHILKSNLQKKHFKSNKRKFKHKRKKPKQKTSK